MNFIIFDFSYILNDNYQLTILSDQIAAQYFCFTTKTLDISTHANGAYKIIDSFSFQQNLSRPHTIGAPKQFCLTPVFDTAQQQRVFPAGAPRFHSHSKSTTVHHATMIKSHLQDNRSTKPSHSSSNAKRHLQDDRSTQPFHNRSNA